MVQTEAETLADAAVRRRAGGAGGEFLANWAPTAAFASAGRFSTDFPLVAAPGLCTRRGILWAKPVDIEGSSSTFCAFLLRRPENPTRFHREADLFSTLDAPVGHFPKEPTFCESHAGLFDEMLAWAWDGSHGVFFFFGFDSREAKAFFVRSLVFMWSSAVFLNTLHATPNKAMYGAPRG